MFEIGEHVIHPGQGVCTVMGFTDGLSPMIILQARQGHAMTRLQFPLANASRLHPCISREDAERLIDGYAELACDPFTERNGGLEEAYFKGRIKLGAPETLRVAKTMIHRMRDAERAARKPSSYCARVLKEARKRTLEELAIALDVSEDEVDVRLQAAEARVAG